MSYPRESVGAGALGATLKSRINWWCWGTPGYQDCHAQSYAAAQQYCQQTASAGFETADDCVVATTDANDFRSCSCPSTPPASLPGEGGSAISTATAVLIAAAVAAVGIAWILTRDTRPLSRSAYGAP
jgi:hypothetical protein